MLSPESLVELRAAWLPHITDAGLRRLIEMLERNSPLLISGSFTRAIPMGCLASHIAWNHPSTCRLSVDAGITWLHQEAGLNPATSRLLQEWDQRGANDLDLRLSLIEEFRAEESRRSREQARRPGSGRTKVTT